MSTVSPAERRRDRLALALVLGGAVVALVSHLQLRAIATGVGIDRVPSRELHNLARVDRWSYASRAGSVLVLAGVAVGIWSFFRHVSRPTVSESHEQEDRSRSE